MVRLLIVFLVFTVIAAMISMVFKKYIEESVPITLLSIIIIQYVIGMLTGNLLAGYYAVLIVAIMSTLFIIIYFKKGKKSEILNYCLTPVIVVFFFAFIYLFWLNRGRLFIAWDEFSHWGLVVKNMNYFNTFANTDASTTIFKDYPPATALFEYFILKICNVYDEGKAMSALGCLTVSMMLPMLRDEKGWKFTSIIKIAISVMILMIIPMMLYRGIYSQVYVDPILGVMFAYILYLYFAYEKLDGFRYINILAAVFVLCLIKDTGFALALIACCIIVIHIIKTDIDRYKKINKINLLKSCGIILSAVTSKFSWTIYMELTGTSTKTWDYSDITLSAIWKILIGQGKEYQYVTYKNFIESLLQPLFMNISYVAWIIIAILISIILLDFIQYYTDERKKIRFSIWGIIVGVIIYTIGLLILYMFIYSEQEAMSLASYDRYLSSILLGLIMYEAFLLVKYFMNKVTIKKMMVVLIFLITMMGINPLLDITIYRTERIEKTNWDRYQYSFINFYDDILSKDDNVWYVSQLSDGYDAYVARYNLTPNHIGIKDIPSPRLGEMKEGGSYRENYTAEEWAEILSKSYTYVYLFELDQQFYDKYSSLFESIDAIQKGGMYKICNENGKVILREVE